MVDVSAKEATARSAIAGGSIKMTPETLQAIQAGSLAKGDVLSVARLAGVMAAKKTADLIPLCHPVPLDHIDVRLSIDEQLPGIRVEAEARCVARTGVEMEALVAATVALVTVYDMAKSSDRSMVIGDISLIEKSGGRTGTYRNR